VCILLVDDEELVRECVSAYLEERGYRVLQARDGKHALEVALEFGHRIKAVVSDIEMPCLNGVEMWKRMKELVTPACRILFLSGNASQYGPRELGGECLGKPASLSQIAAKVNDIVSSS